MAAYGSFKKYFQQECYIFQKVHPGRIINQSDIAKVLTEAYVKSAARTCVWCRRLCTIFYNVLGSNTTDSAKHGVFYVHMLL